MTRYLTAEDALTIARIAIGSTPHLRDAGLLDSACHRPSATVFGEDAYPTLILKAAALLHSLTANLPFIDGNKRTAWLATVVFLRDNGAEVITTDDYDGEAARLVLAIADGSLREVEDIARLLAGMVVTDVESP
ncbi:MAG TPA: type II toxin-antitoxin system death-on-curing family toxin [Nakamurella sp.]